MTRCNLIMDKRDRLTTTAHLFFGVVVMFAIFKGYLSYFAPSINPLISDVFRLYLNNIIVPYGIGLAILWLIIRKIPAYTTHYPSKKLTKYGFFKLMILQLGFSVLVSLIFILVLEGTGSVYNDFPMDYGAKHLLFYLFLLLIFNPLIEELLFRKILLSRLLKWGENYAIIVSSVFFALPHFFSQGIPIVFSTFISGCIWGYVTVKTGKITSAVLLHSFSNFFGIFLPMLFPQSETGDLLFVLLRVVVIPIIAIIILIRDSSKEDFFVSKIR